MPFLLKLDIALLAVSVAVSSGLLIVTLGTGLRRGASLWFALFLATVVSWTVWIPGFGQGRWDICSLVGF